MFLCTNRPRGRPRSHRPTAALPPHGAPRRTRCRSHDPHAAEPRPAKAETATVRSARGLRHGSAHPSSLGLGRTCHHAMEQTRTWRRYGPRNRCLWPSHPCPRQPLSRARHAFRLLRSPRRWPMTARGSLVQRIAEVEAWLSLHELSLAIKQGFTWGRRPALESRL